MLSKSFSALLAITLLSLSDLADARIRWAERDGKAIVLHPRRFGQEHPAVIEKLSAACPGQVCGVLGGSAITPLLAAQGECTQQDMADQIIDQSKQFDAATQANMLAIAIEYRQVEKNTPPDFTTNPPTNRNSVFCQKAPKNAELNGLVQAQDPSNDPNLFFDPATKASVKLGSQANTSPFGSSGAGSSASNSSSAATSASNSSAATSTDSSAATTTSAAILIATDVPTSTDDSSVCPTAVTVTMTVGASATAAAATASAAAVTTAAAASTATGAASSSNLGNFGSCSVPQIEFATGFDNRKETSFQPVDKASYNHGSAQAAGIVTQFICDTLVNSCGADATAQATCKTAKAASDAAPPKTGAQADAFNAGFNIKTDFSAVAQVDDQGRVVAGTGSGSAAASAPAAASATASAAASSSTASTSTGTAATGSSGIGNFGSCSVPQIEFATGFDNRKETAFQPVDKASYNHGSAQAAGIITQFICDTLTNSCGADATAKATCATAKAASDAAAAKTGAQADAFNAGFGITTNFAAVAEVDNQGNVVAGTGSGSAASGSGSASSAGSSAASNAATPAAATTAAAASASSATASSSSASTAGNLQTFTGSLGGVTAPAVTSSGGQFQVDGNSAFNNKQNALVRSCDVQHNKCANAANSSGNKGDLTVTACGDQQTQCNAAAQSA
ncbi:hypothetical protein OF83DRAFT_652043 [Amylostereum chailletii]|nr:hypothetical protein OF83DRAFT_652043 [Amylostereum chailletii]